MVDVTFKGCETFDAAGNRISKHHLYNKTLAADKKATMRVTPP